jgi:hypothetical protein
MKIRAFILAFLLLLPLYAHAGIVASGSVSQANMKLSTVNGTAFVDFSSAGAFTAYAGCKLTVTDSTGDKLVGWIKAMGVAETLDSEIFTNGNFETGDPPTGWTGSGDPVAILSSVADERTGGSGSKCLNIATIAADKSATNNVSTVVGVLYKYSGWLKKITATAMLNFYGDASYQSTSLTWEEKSGYHTSKNTLGVRLTNLTAGDARFDDVSLKKVLTPSGTGATIVSAQGGATYNWTSIGASFTYNDAGGYTYTIERGGAALLMGW